MKINIGIVVSHPIQYYAHQYRHIAGQSDVRARVFFESDRGSRPAFDPGFHQTFAWKMPILEGYDHLFLTEQERPEVSRTLSDELSRFNPDALLIHGYAQSVSRAAWGWAKRHRVPIFMIGDSNVREERRKPLALRLVKQVLLRPFFSSLDGFLTIGSSNEAYYKSYGVPERRMIRVPFTADPGLFDPVLAKRERERSLFRERVGLAPEAVAGLWCGKMTANKRPLDYVKALAGLASSGPPVTALYAGDGDLRNAIEAAAKQAGVPAVFAGFLNVDEMPAAYAAADFLVHTRPWEPYGLVATEGACMGLPMIVPDSMGAVGDTDAARPGVNARVFQGGEPGGLRPHLEAVAGDAGLRLRMGRESTAVYHDLRRRFECGIAEWLARVGRSARGAA